MNRIGPRRRGFLFGAMCAAGCGDRAIAQPARPDCVDLTAPPPAPLAAEEQERHEVFLLLAMALVYDAWGVDRSNPAIVAEYAAAEPGRSFPDYAGHNIGAVLVDGTGRVTSCALNRNVLLNNSMAHAEARTVDNAFRIANTEAGPGGPGKWSFSSIFKRSVLYTTLEPCSQCAGIMALANIEAVVFGQDDPGQHRVANVLYNLAEGGGRSGGAALPIRAAFQPFWPDLQAAYDGFEATAPGQGGATRFLQTVAAYRIYGAAARRFETLAASAANAPVLAGARQFRARWRGAVQSDGAAPQPN